MRGLTTLFKKEYDLLVRYERSHRHFFRYFALDAILTVGLVFGGFLLFESHSAPESKLVHAGAVAMTPKEFVEHIKHQPILAYWMGAIRNYENTVNHEVPGTADIFYIPNGADPITHESFLYEVKSYVGQTVWNAHTHTILASANTTTIAINGTTTIKINKSSMRGVIVTFSDKPEIVAIAYPKPQTLINMIKNVASLKLIR